MFLIRHFWFRSCEVLVLQDYIFAIINSVGSYYLSNSHSRNSSELPIENGGTVAMLQFSNNINLLNHITHLPRTLHVEKFEIVPITMTCTTEQIPPIIKIIFNKNNVMSSKPIQSDTGILLQLSQLSLIRITERSIKNHNLKQILLQQSQQSPIESN